MIVTVFRARLQPENSEEYYKLAAELSAMASTMPGYISRKAYTAEDGEKLTIVEFESEETHRAWAEHPSHRAAQKIGREKFYAEYSIRICKELRSNAFRNAG
jgi:heme-degrading monooxygenase HmoA